MMQRFLNRQDAGKQLAQRLMEYTGRPGCIVLALPRGGVPVAYEVAAALNLPLDIWIVRKLGLPGQEELAIGAIASGGVHTLNEDIIAALAISPEVINRVKEQEMVELQRRERLYRGDRPAPDIRDRTVILIDDGMATGASMLAALRALRTQNPVQIVVAVPAASLQAVGLLRKEADEIVYVLAPEPFEGVGKWYDDFSQTKDEEVRILLENTRRHFSDG